VTDIATQHTTSTVHGADHPVGSRVEILVGMNAGQTGEIVEVHELANQPAAGPYRWYGVQLPDGLRPVFRHDELAVKP
jgi:hypothetical protein